MMAPEIVAAELSDDARVQEQMEWFQKFTWSELVYFFDCSTERIPIRQPVEPWPDDLDMHTALESSLDQLAAYAARINGAVEEIGIPVILPPYPSGLLFEVMWKAHDHCRIWREPMMDILASYAGYAYPDHPTLTVRHTFPKQSLNQFSARPPVSISDLASWEIEELSKTSGLTHEEALAELSHGELASNEA